MSQIPCTPIQIDINGSFGDDFLGLILSSVFYGVTTLQTIFYYQTYPKDSFLFKTLVGVVWALDTASLALDSHGVYTYLVTNWSNPAGIAGLAVWSIASEPAVTGTVSLLVREFLIYRIYAFNRGWRFFATLLAVACLFPFGFSIVVVWRTDTGSQLVTAVVKELHWMAIVGCSTSASLDLIIAFSICFQLYMARTGVTNSEKMIQLITIYIITSGLVTASINIAVLVSFLVSNSLAFQLFTMLGSKAYANALLATLNSRRSIRGRAEDPVATYSVSKMAFRAGSNGQSSRTNGTGDVPPGLGSKLEVGIPLSTVEIRSTTCQPDEGEFEE